MFFCRHKLLRYKKFWLKSSMKAFQPVGSLKIKLWLFPKILCDAILHNSLRISFPFTSFFTHFFSFLRLSLTSTDYFSKDSQVLWEIKATFQRDSRWSNEKDYLVEFNGNFPIHFYWDWMKYSFRSSRSSILQFLYHRKNLSCYQGFVRLDDVPK